jgi:Zn-dependent protease
MHRVHIHPSLVLWLSILFYLRPRLVAAFLLAAGLHELGHFFALVLLERQPQGVTLSCFGAAMETPALSYRQTLTAAAAGPAVNLLLTLLWDFCPGLARCSAALGLFNLLPIPGLDGEKMLSAWLLLHFPQESVFRVCQFIAILVALVFWGAAIYLAGPMQLGFGPMVLAALLLYKALAMEDP